MSQIHPEDLAVVDPQNGAEVGDFLKTHGVSLTLDEFGRMCELLGRLPSTVELHIFNTMWSEHCSYKSSRPTLGKYLPTRGPHVVLGPGEDAGIIRFARIDGRSVCLVMAHESHNHPSQVLPVEGAATGIGGIVRDVYCMGADVIGVMDPLRFGDPDGPNAGRVRDIAYGVVDGIAQYGNALGVPNYGGEAYFDATFDDNCLVNVVAFGIIDEEDIVRSRVPDEARKEDYDVILFGKPTDASGFGGAAFASERLSEEEAVERQGAVQVPDPFLKRVLAEAIKSMLDWARKGKVAIGFKDLGAGGISCAVSEMAEAAGMGVSIDLEKVNVAHDDLPPEVISCSETQERFLVAVPSRLSGEVLQIFNEHYELPNLYAGAGARVIGRVTAEKQFTIRRGDRVVCDADVVAITTGIQYDRESEYRPRKLPSLGLVHTAGAAGIAEALRYLLASVNIADRSPLYQHYDCEVQAHAVLRPGEADACVEIMVPGHSVALATSIGSNSRLGVVDPYLGGAWSVCEAVRNVACVGALPLAITDCLNYGDPEDPGVFHEFVEGVRGIGDACRGLKVDGDHGVPVVSGNVSFYNQSETGAAVAPTPIVSCAGRIDDASVARDLGFKSSGSRVALIGRLHGEIAGSEYEKYFTTPVADAPRPDFGFETSLVRTLIDGINSGAILAAHDIALGGVLVTAAEMVIGSGPAGVGATLDLRAVVDASVAEASQLFSEYGGVVVEIAEAEWGSTADLARRHGVPFLEIGRTNDAGGLNVILPSGEFGLSAEELANLNKGSIEELLFKP